MSQSDNRSGSSSKSHASGGRGRSTNYTERKSTASGSRSQSSRSRSTYSPRGGRRRKKPQYDITRLLLGILIVLAVIIAIAAVMKFTKGPLGEKKTEVETTTTETETELAKAVTVDGIAITGMSREDAKKAIMKEYTWGLKVTYKDQEYQVVDMMESKIDTLLAEIYTGEAKESYTLDTSGLEDAIGAEVRKVAAMWDVPAKNGSISSFDKEAGKFVYAGEQTGIVIDQDKLEADIQAQIDAKNFQASIEATAKEVAPEISEAQAKELYQVIGTYTTTTTANKDRNKNIELASKALDGLILQPGQEFSFNKTTGERSLAKGYKPAGAYLNGVLVEEPGGGVCQVSSTLYNAVVFSGLTTTERHAHSYEPSYVTPGEDAMVSYGGPDMKFVNSSSTAIAIRASFADRKLKISIVGIPILESGVKLSMKSQKTGELDAPAPVYEEDQTLEPGVEKIVKAETKGSRWVTNLITTKDGVVVSDEFFHNSTYRGKSATIKRNTSGVVVTTGASSGAGESSSAAETSTAENQSQGQTDSAHPAGPGENTGGPGADTTQGSTAASGGGPGENTAATTPAETSAPSTEAESPQPGASDGMTNVVPPPPGN